MRHSYHRQQSLFNLRLLFLLAVFLIFVILILAQLFDLQITKAAYMLQRSQNNQYKAEAITPQRGKIYDRNHRLLAHNQPIFHVHIIPSTMKKRKPALSQLAQKVKHLPQFAAAVTNYRKNLKPKSNPRVIANIHPDDVHHLHRILSGSTAFKLLPEFIRTYPCAEACAAVTGYVSSAHTHKQGQQADTITAHYTGVTGIEKQYQQQLGGTIGSMQYQHDAQGNITKTTAVLPAVPGTDVILHIDVDLQNIIHRHMQAKKGAVIIINPKDGAVLALYSAPSYDPNAFTAPGMRAMKNKILVSTDLPLYNRALQGGFPPASTLKPFLALHALQDKLIDRQTSIHDPGYFKLPGSDYTYYNWKRSGHGTVNVAKAISQSNDTFFYQLALKQGADKQANILNQYGFGQPTLIDLPNEKPGILPCKSWQRRRGKPWLIADTIISGIGQGAHLSTPVQVASAVSTLSQKGQGYRPRVAHSLVFPDGETSRFKAIALPPVDINQPDWQHIIQAMRSVIQFGTGRRLGGLDLDIAGKTGTAQVIKNSGKDQGYAKHLLDHSWFIGFTPSGNADLAIVVLLEHDNSAILTAKAILDDYLSLQKHATI